MEVSGFGHARLWWITVEVSGTAAMPRGAYPEVIGLAGAQLVARHRARRRTVRRRARYLANGAGFVCANDGPALASGLARLRK
jgi:hypothetical protein